jgi:hypothetical protein
MPEMLAQAQMVFANFPHLLAVATHEMIWMEFLRLCGIWCQCSQHWAINLLIAIGTHGNLANVGGRL